MTKGKQRRSLHGAVLIMVLTVMVVLIIMLMATLTVVTTAGQRIYTKFEENQAYYTARSALDVFTNNMLGDSAYIAYDTSGKRDYKYTKDDGTPGTVEMKQGLALQLDLYKIASQNEDGVDLQWLENAFEGDGTFAAGSAEEENYTLEVGVDHTGVYANGLPYIEYDITFPTVTSSTDANAHGKIVDIDINDDDNDGEKTDQVARIRVEILDRKLHTATEFTEADILATIANPAGNPTATPPVYSQADIQAAIANGIRSKDYMKIKITATVQMMDTEGVAVVIFETNEKETPATDNALTTTGSFSGAGGAQVRTAGGVSTMDIGISAAGDGNYMSGSMFTLGQLQWTSSAATKINKNEMIVAWGGVASSSNPTNIEATGDGTYAFFGGASEIYNNSTFGNATYKVPLIAENVKTAKDGVLTVNGDMYVNTFEHIDTNANKVTVTGTSYVQNLILPNSNQFVTYDGAVAKINLSALSNMNLKLCKDYTITINGVVYDSSNYYTAWEEATANIGSYTETSVDGFDINNFTVVKKDDCIYRKYNLPFAVDGKNEIEVPTAQAYFAEYFVDGAFHETTGDLKNYNSQTDDGITDPANNLYTDIYSDTNKNMWLYDAADMLSEYLELPAVAAGSPKRTITSMINDNEIPNIEALPDGGTITLDSGDKFFLADSDYYGKNWNITGTNGRAIIIIPEGQTVKFDNCTITTDNINLTTASITDGITKAPKVDIYAGTNAKIDTGNQNFFAAYFMMPTAELYLNNGKSGINYTNGTGAVSSVSNVGIVGSVLCGNFSESNQTGILYLNKDSGAETPGEPHLSVQASHYSRK